MKDILRFQVIFKGHLRGSSHLKNLKDFFECIDINVINKSCNTNYKCLDIKYVLYTYREISFKEKIKEYGKLYYPELYKDYSLDDFDIWLNEYKNTFSFDNVIVEDPVKLKTKSDNDYLNCINQINDEYIKDNLNHLKYHSGYQFTKYEETIKYIDEDVDLVIQIRPDLFFNFDFENKIQETKEYINNQFIKILNDKSINPKVFLHFFHCSDGQLRAGDYWHIGRPKTIKEFYKDIQLNNLNIRREFTYLNKELHPTIIKYLENYIYSYELEKNSLINCKIKKIDIDISWFMHTLLYIYVPFELNKNGMINYHTIHDYFIKPN